MSRAKEISGLADNIVNELKPGDHIKFGSNHKLSGELGRIIDQNKDGTFNVRFASATVKEVPAGDMTLAGELQ